MKTGYLSSLLMWLILLISEQTFSQAYTNHLKKSNKMEVLTIQTANKEAIHTLYDTILNKRQLNRLNTLISTDYTNKKNGKGVEAFQHSILELIHSFPDAQWILEEIVADGNKVYVKQQFTGTQKNPFQHLAPTNKFVTVDGIASYVFRDNKIIQSEIQTDRLGFLQQLNALPADLSSLPQTNENEKPIYFIDKFFIPENSIREFTERMNYNRKFIKQLPGFIKDEVYEQKDGEGNLVIITIATWANQQSLENAKNAVQAEYKKTGFNPIEFSQRLNIKMDRGEYSRFTE